MSGLGLGFRAYRLASRGVHHVPVSVMAPARTQNAPIGVSAYQKCVGTYQHGPTEYVSTPVVSPAHTKNAMVGVSMGENSPREVSVCALQAGVFRQKEFLCCSGPLRPPENTPVGDITGHFRAKRGKLKTF